MDQLTEGLRYVRTRPLILLAITVLGVVSTVALNFQVMLPLLARDVLGGDATTFGFLTLPAASARWSAPCRWPSAGADLSTRADRRWRDRCRHDRRRAFSSVPVSLVLMALAGWGLITMAATTNMLIQLIAPDNLRGRALSVYTTVFAGTTPFGALFAGGLAASAGVAVALAVGGLLAVAATLGGVIWVARDDRLSMSAEPALRPLDVGPSAGR